MLDERFVGCHDSKFVRAISWVICHGHHKILQCIIDQIIKEKGDVSDLFQTSYNKTRQSSDIGTRMEENALHSEPVTLEQWRLLCLGCYSGDLNKVQILLYMSVKTLLKIQLTIKIRYIGKMNHLLSRVNMGI